MLSRSWSRSGSVSPMSARGFKTAWTMFEATDKGRPTEVIDAKTEIETAEQLAQEVQRKSG